MYLRCTSAVRLLTAAAAARLLQCCTAVAGRLRLAEGFQGFFGWPKSVKNEAVGVDKRTEKTPCRCSLLFLAPRSVATMPETAYRFIHAHMRVYQLCGTSSAYLRTSVKDHHVIGFDASPSVGARASAARYVRTTANVRECEAECNGCTHYACRRIVAIGRAAAGFGRLGGARVGRGSGARGVAVAVGVGGVGGGVGGVARLLFLNACPMWAGPLGVPHGATAAAMQHARGAGAGHEDREQ